MHPHRSIHKDGVYAKYQLVHIQRKQSDKFLLQENASVSGDLKLEFRIFLASSITALSFDDCIITFQSTKAGLESES